MSDMSTDEIVVSFNSPEEASKSAGPVELGRRLLGAARDGDSDAVLELLGLGAPFSTDWLGTSPLHLAAANDRADVCAVLLRAGVSRDCRTKVERTPLHLAAYWGHAAAARLLLQHGADPNARDLLGMTPLHWAAERGHAAVARLLIQHDADPNLQSRFLTTPLQLAAGEAQPVLAGAARDTAPAPESPPSPRPAAPDPPPADPPPSAAAADLLLRHGISLLPPDDAGTVMRALLSGRTVLLSDAGKLMLQENATPPSAVPAAPPAPAPAPAAPPAPRAPASRPRPLKLFSLGDKLVALQGARRPLRVVLHKSSVDRLASPVSSDEEAEGVVRVPDQFLRSQDPEYLRAQLLAAHAALQRLRRRLKARKARPPDDT